MVELRTAGGLSRLLEDDTHHVVALRRSYGKRVIIRA